MITDPAFIESINVLDFKEESIPNYNPISQKFERITYWKEQKRRCIEGHWSNGVWMPGVLYFYINFWNIERGGKKGGNIGKHVGSPDLRDLEWDKAYIYVEARGFSGFELDDKYTCNRLLTDESKQKLIEDDLLTMYIDYGYINARDLDKKYIPAREYLRTVHRENLGKPMFQNEAMNVIDMEAREGGKSFWASAMIAHNFLFDGAYDYDIYLESKLSKNYLTSQTLVGAIDSSFSGDLLKKFALGFRHLPGNVKYKEVEFPSPLSCETEGSLLSGKTFRSKENGISKSSIKHVSFKDNPLAAAGTRPSLVLLEEVGFFSNIEESLGALKECVSQSGRQFGTIYMFGTGGLVSGIALNYTKYIFYHPDEYNCLGFNDIYENRGKIGYFIPKHYTLGQFKEGPNMITNFKKADKFLDEEINKNKDNRLKQAIDLINNPRFPSHMFFTVEGMFFPTMELKEATGILETKHKLLDSSLKGFVIINEAGETEWKNTNDKPIREYPFKATKSSQGCIEIFEPPVRNTHGDIPSGIYYAGFDPIEDDDLVGSLQSAFIVNKLTRRIVAEYTARHETAKEYWENLRRLLMYYNARCNYENQKKGVYQYFETKNSIYLLCETPKILKDTSILSKTRNTGNKSIGTPATENINKWARNLVNQWLLEPMYGDDEKLNLFHIRSLALLQELTTWNPEANFDRISALGMVMIILEDRSKVIIDQEKKIETINDRIDKFLNPKMTYGRNLENIPFPKIKL